MATQQTKVEFRHVLKPAAPGDEIVLNLSRFLRKSGFLAENPEPLLDADGLRVNQRFHKATQSAEAVVAVPGAETAPQRKDASSASE